MELVKGGRLGPWVKHGIYGRIRELKFPCPVGHTISGASQEHFCDLKEGDHDAYNVEGTVNTWGFKVLREFKPGQTGLIQIEPSVLYGNDPCQYHSTRPWQCEIIAQMDEDQ